MRTPTELLADFKGGRPDPKNYEYTTDALQRTAYDAAAKELRAAYFEFEAAQVDAAAAKAVMLEQARRIADLESELERVTRREANAALRFAEQDFVSPSHANPAKPEKKEAP